MLFHSRTFVAFIAGFLNFSSSISFYGFRRPSNRSLIFKKGQNEIQNYIIVSFHSELLQVLNDSCIYRVRYGNFSMIMFPFAVDADSLCDYGSNVDFVHFLWDNCGFQQENLPLLFFRRTTYPLHPPILHITVPH
jgi:hypothetical protein